MDMGDLFIQYLKEKGLLHKVVNNIKHFPTTVDEEEVVFNSSWSIFSCLFCMTASPEGFDYWFYVHKDWNSYRAGGM